MQGQLTEDIPNVINALTPLVMTVICLCVCAFLYSELEPSNGANGNVVHQSLSVNPAYLYSEVVPTRQRSQSLASSSAAAAAAVDDLAAKVLKTFQTLVAVAYLAFCKRVATLTKLARCRLCS